MSTLRLGTRGSKLALAQAGLVAAGLRAAQPDLTIETVIIQTTGDQRKESLKLIGGQGAFTRELESALLDGAVDVAVHSLKDLPSMLPPGLMLGAVPPREDPRDVLVAGCTRPPEAFQVGSLDAGSAPHDLLSPTLLLPGSRVGTGSLRRAAQLLRLRPDVRIVDIRGNVDTRLRKLDEGEYDAIILAAAGLLRLGHGERITRFLPPAFFLPAVGQAALGLECRVSDEGTRALLAAIDDVATSAAVSAERAVLRAFGAGCRLPIAAFAEPRGESMVLRARVLDPEGRIAIDQEAEGRLDEAEQLGAAVAARLLESGASVLLESAHVGA